MKNNIELIAGSRHTVNTLVSQLKRLLGEDFKIKGYAMSDQKDKNIILNHVAEDETLVIFSSRSVYNDYKEVNKNKLEEFFIGSRTINNSVLDMLLLLPEEKILAVNDEEESIIEGLECLKDIGIDISKFIPYYPGCKIDKEIKIAITFGELDLVPNEIKKVYDLGVRIFDLPSLLTIFQKMDTSEGIKHFANIYSEEFVKMANRIAEVIKEKDRLSQTLKQKLLGKGHYAKYNFDDIEGISEIIKKQKAIASKLAKTDLVILIEGENGTGKELFASAIHKESERKKYPFVAVNFSALSEDLIESELFGYEEGAFTGAKKGGKIGLFEQANGGTIFLDEIGDISSKTQTRLLRVIQENEIMRVGGDRIIPIDVRIIAATNKNLRELVQNGSFREDLYYRLKMAVLSIPPLRERRVDIPSIINKIMVSSGITSKINDDVIEVLSKLEWRGNVRELVNTIKYMDAICEDNILKIGDIPEDILEKKVYSIEQEILQSIENLSKIGVIAGRDNIVKELTDRGIQISMYQVRKHIEILKNQREIESGSGYGLKIVKNK